MAELHLSRPRIRPDTDAFMYMEQSLSGTTGDWTAAPGGPAGDSFNDTVVIPFLNGAHVKIPLTFRSGVGDDLLDFKRNIQFLAECRNFVRQLLDERARLLREVDEWKTKAEDYRDILVRQGRRANATNPTADES